MHFNCKTYAPELIAEIAAEYASGIAMHVLAKKHRMASKTLMKLFSVLNIECRGVKESIAVSPERVQAKFARRKLSPEDRSQFCHAYDVGGMSVANLANKFGISEGIARKILKKQEGIFREPAYRSYTADSSFFLNIDSTVKAYWLGFIMADGCVFEGASPGLRIGLKGSDAGHLESFRGDIGSNHPIRLSDKKYLLHGVEKSAPACAIDIRNRELFDSLVAHGCVPNKTNVQSVISGVPDHLFSHFARGYFDGDGCISFCVRKNRITKNGTAYIDPTWSCVGNLSVMSYIRGGLASHTGMDIPSLNQRKGCWHLAISGVHKVRTLFDFFYSEGGPCLPRKYKKVAGRERCKYLIILS